MRHIVESPNTNRTLSWCQYSRMTGNTDLAESCSKFILSNFGIVMKAADWAELTVAEMTEFLSSSDLIVKSEFELWTELVKWFTSENNIENLESNLANIIPLLRFTMILPNKLLEIEDSDLCREHKEAFSEKLNKAYRHHSLLYDQVELWKDVENFRNYSADLYGLCHDMSMLNYDQVDKIASRIYKTISVPLLFISKNYPRRERKMVEFEVNFWPKGFYTTYTLYGSHMGKQSDCTTLTVRRTGSTDKIDAVITVIIYGMKNGVKYVAYTYTKSHTFSSSESNVFNEENVFNLENLSVRNSSYLINGNLDMKLFIKCHHVPPKKK